MKIPTGGIAHEPQGMIRCNSEADSKVWMKEDNNALNNCFCRILALKCIHFRVFFTININLRGKKIEGLEYFKAVLFLGGKYG